jgi:hypothetical protein
MASRFMALRQDDGKYCVWDNAIGALARAVQSQTLYENLGFDQAIDAAIELNTPRDFGRWGLAQ